MKNLLEPQKNQKNYPQNHHEKSLFSGCLQRDPKIQRELFNTLSPKMFTICLRYIKETAAAEDILLIAFGKIFERIHQFQQKGSFEGWIKRIVINECLMYLEKKNHFVTGVDLDGIQPIAIQSDPLDLLEWEDLINMVNTLPEGYQKVFEMFVLKGMSHEEISKHLGVSKSTSKSQLWKARNHLQRLIRIQN